MSTRTKAELFLLAITFIWGSTFVVTKSLLQEVSPFVYVAVRFAVASVLLFLVFPKKILAIDRRAVLHGTILGLLLFVGFVLQTIGLTYTTASKSAFMTGMLVVFTPLCQLAIERRAPKLGNIIGVALVTVGLYMLTSPYGSSFNRGDAMTLICAGLFAFYIVFLDMFGKQNDAAHLTWTQFILCAVLGALAAPFMETPKFMFSERSLLSLSYLAVFATVVAIFVQARYQKDTTPTRSAIIFSAEPVIAAAFAYLMIGERLGLLGVLGGAAILAGLLVSELSDVIFRNAGVDA